MSGKLPNKKLYLKQYYVYSSKLYMLDYLIWASMFQSKQDPCYQPVMGPEWVRIMENYEEVKMDKDSKLINSYMKFSQGVSLSLAGFSKASNYE